MQNTIDHRTLITELEELERRVRELRLRVEKGQEVQTRSPQRGRRGIQVGDKVRTLNLRPFQDKEGEVLKVNEAAGYVSILGTKKRKTIRRKNKNVLKIESFRKKIEQRKRHDVIIRIREIHD